MSREGKLAKNTLILSIGTFLPKFASFITLPILTGCLTKSEYGMYDLVIVLVSLLLPAATLQIQTAAFRFLIDCRDDNDKIRKIVTNIFIFIFPTSLIALTVLFFCLYKQPISVRIFICLYFYADIGVNAARQVSRGLDKNIHYSVSSILSAFGKMIFAVICVYWLRAGLLGTVISLFAASFVSFLYLFFKVRLYEFINIKYFDAILLKDMLRYSWPMVPNSMSAWVMRVSDRLVVTAVMGVSANAVYSVANKIPSLLNLAQNTFTLAWQENASVVSKDKDASEYYSSMFRMMFDLMAGFFGILIAATPVLFKVLIRGDYSDAYYQMPILFVAMFFFSMSTFLGGIYVAYKHSKSVGITTTIAAAINFITDIGTIRWIGLYAASGSTLVSYIFLFIFRIIDVQKIVKVRYSMKHLTAVIFIIIVESILCYRRSLILNIINLFLGTIVFCMLNKSFMKAVYKKIIKLIKRGKSVTDNHRAKTDEDENLFATRENKSIVTTVNKPASSAKVEDSIFMTKEQCCGCSACCAICPVRAIVMQADSEGFLYPEINKEKCIECNLCRKVCSFSSDQKIKGFMK